MASRGEAFTLETERVVDAGDIVTGGGVSREPDFDERVVLLLSLPFLPLRDVAVRLVRRGAFSRLASVAAAQCSSAFTGALSGTPLAGASLPYWPEEMREEVVHKEWRPPPEKVAEETENYRGGWIDQMRSRAPKALSLQTGGFLFFGAWRAGGMMLIGMALFQYGVFAAARSALAELGAEAVQ